MDVLSSSDSSSTFHHCRRRVIDLLEPLPAVRELRVESTGLDTGDTEFPPRTQNTGLAAGITFGWTEENLRTNSSGRKQRATPF